jgi:hypothetical protein
MEFGSRILRLANPAMTGQDVLMLQRALIAFGSANYPVPCNSLFTNATELALNKFQIYFNLAETGVADEAVYKTISQWFQDMKPVMEEFLKKYKCDHSNIIGADKASSDEMGCRSQDHQGRWGLQAKKVKKVKGLTTEGKPVTDVNVGEKKVYAKGA